MDFHFESSLSKYGSPKCHAQKDVSNESWLILSADSGKGHKFCMQHPGGAILSCQRAALLAILKMPSEHG